MSQNRQQLLMAAALRAIAKPIKINDAKTLCHSAGAWLAQSGLAAAVDSVTRYQHQDISKWLLASYTDALKTLGVTPGADFRSWALGLSSVENLRVTRDLIEFNHTLTRLARMKDKGLL